MELNETYTEPLISCAVTDSFNGTLSARSGYERGYREPIHIYFPDGESSTQVVVHDVEKGEKRASLYVPEKLKEMLLQLTEEEHSQGGGDVDPPTGESTDDDSREM